MESERLKEKYKHILKSIHHKRLVYEALNILIRVRSVPGPVSRLSMRISTIVGVLRWEFNQNVTGGYPLKSFTAEYRKYRDVRFVVNKTENVWMTMDPNNIPANVVSLLLEIFFMFLNIYLNTFECTQADRIDLFHAPANALTIYRHLGERKKLFDLTPCIQWTLFLISYPLCLQRYYEVYHLKPNTTYEFRIWANNYLGAGEIAYTMATTLSQLTDKGKLIDFKLCKNKYCSRLYCHLQSCWKSF